MGTETKFNCYTESNSASGAVGLGGGAVGGGHSGVGVVGLGGVCIPRVLLAKGSSTNGITQPQESPQHYNTFCSTHDGAVIPNGRARQHNGSGTGCGSGSGNDSKQTAAAAAANPLTAADDGARAARAAAVDVDAAAVPFVPIHVDENHVIEGAKEILRAIRPHWDLNSVQFKKFTDGITNKLVGCFYAPAAADSGHSNGGGSGNGTSTAPTGLNGHGSSNGHNNHKTVIAEGAANGGGGTSNGGGAGRASCYDNHDDSGNLSDDENDAVDGGATVDRPPCVDNNNSVVLVRVYGTKTDLLIDRKAEMRNILLLHAYGFAPSLYATFRNGLVYDYVPGVTLNTRSVLLPAVWHSVARRMADMHRMVQCAGAGAGTVQQEQQPPVPMLWKKTQSFFDLVPERFSDADKQARALGTFLPIARLRDEFLALYRHLETLGSPLVFAHNDLLLGNVVYTESRQSVSFIDYEYADFNFQAFDIGNHFAEFAGVDEVDYARYPGRDFQLEWLRVYLEAYLQRRDVRAAEVERLYVQVNQFALASHFFWTIWSLIQAEHSTIDFDYLGYAFLRYNEYVAKKEEFLALEVQRSS